MERVLVSACLLGHPVRYDGRAALCTHPILARWHELGRIVPLCPESAGGLPTPRPPAEIQPGAGGPQLLAGGARVIGSDGGDFTTAFVAGAHHALALCRAHRIRVAVLKQGSPSCGSNVIYDGRFAGSRIPGQGVTAALLTEAGIQVFDEHGLAHAEHLLLTLA
ncbi:MAG: DUF523 domain-containing protein [Rhodocyclaceae bacterium]